MKAKKGDNAKIICFRKIVVLPPKVKPQRANRHFNNLEVWVKRSGRIWMNFTEAAKNPGFG